MQNKWLQAQDSNLQSSRSEGDILHQLDELAMEPSTRFALVTPLLRRGILLFDQLGIFN